MVGPSSPKAHHSLHIFSMKSSSPPTSSSSISSMKLKTLLQTFIFSHVYRIARALTKAKSILFELLKDIQLLHLLEFPLMKKNKNKNKLFLGSFRLHYNWCSSSHVAPLPPEIEGHHYTKAATNHLYYDSSWNSIIPTECDGDDGDILPDESQLSSYLQWLEEKGQEGNISKRSTTSTDANEIDRLADMFIASCHEKFKLEKQESYRMFQEMMARSV